MTPWKFCNLLNQKGFLAISVFSSVRGIMECWNNGILGIKAKKTILNSLNSSLPAIALATPGIARLSRTGRAQARQAG